MIDLNLKKKVVDKEILSDGRIVIRERDVEIPKDQQWLLVLAKLKEKGYGFRFVYGDEVLEKPLKFAYDEERGGIGVKKPDRVLLVKKFKQGHWEEEKVVGDIDFNDFADPTPLESLLIVDLVEVL